MLLLGISNVVLAWVFLCFARLEIGTMTKPFTGHLGIDVRVSDILLGAHVDYLQRFKRGKQRTLQIAVAMKASSGNQRSSGTTPR